MREEVGRWWKRAQEDLETARVNRRSERFYAAAFFAQQSVEKALKALSIAKKNKFRKIHDLVALGREVKLPQRLIDYCREISPAYTYTRYPDVIEPADLKPKIGDLIDHAEEVLKWVQKRI
ncbi:MAG: HEPN domain-containing protein [Candidatus Hadarchaeota archaeon]|nr:HEPN domain-containing protein [Candidatus Hadarchaeota archaeon]